MPRRAKPVLLILLVCLFAFALFRARSPKLHITLPAAPMQQEPLTMLWAWETPENLTTLNPQKAGVAFLSRELLIDHTLTVRPRQQPLRLAPNTFLMAVVRIETGPDFTPSPSLVTQAAQAIVTAAAQPNVRALQIDFDATASQRKFYADLLRQLRTLLPPHMPLSITALVSWCGPHPSWLSTLNGVLNIDEAVPMFFRMGGPSASRATAPRSTASVTEPLCATSLGLSIDEAWPPTLPSQRIYLFRPGPWTQKDIAILNTKGYQSLKQ